MPKPKIPSKSISQKPRLLSSDDLPTADQIAEFNIACEASNDPWQTIFENVRVYCTWHLLKATLNVTVPWALESSRAYRNNYVGEEWELETDWLTILLASAITMKIVQASIEISIQILKAFIFFVELLFNKRLSISDFLIRQHAKVVFPEEMVRDSTRRMVMGYFIFVASSFVVSVMFSVDAFQKLDLNLAKKIPVTDRIANMYRLFHPNSHLTLLNLARHFQRSPHVPTWRRHLNLLTFGNSDILWQFHHEDQQIFARCALRFENKDQLLALQCEDPEDASIKMTLTVTAQEYIQGLTVFLEKVTRTLVANENAMSFRVLPEIKDEYFWDFSKAFIKRLQAIQKIERNHRAKTQQLNQLLKVVSPERQWHPLPTYQDAFIFIPDYYYVINEGWIPPELRASFSQQLSDLYGQDKVAMKRGMLLVKTTTLTKKEKLNESISALGLFKKNNKDMKSEPTAKRARTIPKEAIEICKDYAPPGTFIAFFNQNIRSCFVDNKPLLKLQEIITNEHKASASIVECNESYTDFNGEKCVASFKVKVTDKITFFANSETTYYFDREEDPICVIFDGVTRSCN